MELTVPSKDMRLMSSLLPVRLSYHQGPTAFQYITLETKPLRPGPEGHGQHPTHSVMLSEARVCSAHTGTTVKCI